MLKDVLEHVMPRTELPQPEQALHALDYRLEHVYRLLAHAAKHPGAVRDRHGLLLPIAECVQETEKW